MAPAIQQLILPNITDYHDLVTANLEAREALKSDPDGYHNPKPPLSYMAMLESVMPCGPKDYSSVQKPLMVVNGGTDRLVDPRVGFDFANSSSKTKSFYYRDDMWHNIWFDK